MISIRPDVLLRAGVPGEGRCDNVAAMLFVLFVLSAADSAVCFQELSRVELDVAQAGPTISPLLFGQNVEVTRRGIWRGLCAEMVANRKFAVSEDGLPKRWAVIEGGGRVALDASVRYAGTPSLRVEVRREGVWCGIRQVQEALAVQENVRYRLRLWLKTEVDRTVTVSFTDVATGQVLWEAAGSVKPGTWQLISQEFTAASTCDNNRLAISSRKAGVFWIGAVSVQRADAFHGMRRDVVELLRQIRPGSLRYPGGCYAEFYRWQDGLLSVDERPPIGPTGLPFLLPEGDDYDTHEIGIDEFLALCCEVGAEPAITVRVCENTADDAAAWVEYCNGTADTIWGQVRARRGHPAPYNVKCWFVGNELYFFGRGGLSDAAAAARQTQLFAAAMKEVDPGILLVGCTRCGGGDWNSQLVAPSGRLLDLFSMHDYLLDHFQGDLAGIACAPTQVLRPLLQSMQASLRRDLPAGRTCRIAFDEWNTRWGLAGSVGMGIYTAGVLNLLCREAAPLGIERAYYFMAINEGAIQVTPFEARLDTAGKVFNLYKVHHGSSVLQTRNLPADSDLDLCASAASEGQRVYVTLVNRSVTSEQPVELQLRGFTGAGEAAVKLLVPQALDAAARDFHEREEPLCVTNGGRVVVNVPPCAIARVRVGAVGPVE
jgi:alpha-N-arabinofuranosidase